MTISIRTIRASTGERYAVLVGEDGSPLFYPSLYVTVHMRGRSLAVNTIRNALSAIKALYEWQGTHRIDVESRFSRSELLSNHEVHALRDAMQKPLAVNGDRKVVPISRRMRVSTGIQYARLSVIAEYLGFLASQLQLPSSQGSADARSMVALIKANRPKKATKSVIGREDKHLDNGILDLLEQVLKPGSDRNPVGDYSLQLRNALIFSILRLTGLRRGELLNIKIEDIDFTKNTIRVVRRPDSKGDVRSTQPVAKTRERTFPLIPVLVERIHEYVVGHRNKIPAARRHGYLFITHKIGPFCGLPLSNSGFGKFMATLKTVVEGGGNIHAHLLRHHWNYTFSLICESKEEKPEREEKIRSYLMGWSETSGTAATYNHRRIKELAGQAVMDLQNKYLKGSDKGDVE